MQPKEHMKIFSRLSNSAETTLLSISMLPQQAQIRAMAS